jgi:putative tryptophan/tyrosine transport system substrate-binding protein
MRRRDFIAGMGSASAAWPVLARAQLSEKIRRVGVLIALAESAPAAQPRAMTFQQALAKLGWTEGRNVRIDYRWGAGDIDRVSTFAAELVGLGPDVLVVSSTPATAER